jgi:branched-chain amino acid transport system permease protein
VSLWVQIVLSGLAAGSVYGLVGIGHTLVHRLTGIVHFALGDLVGLGVFLTLLVTAGRGPVTQATAAGGRFALGLVVALVVTTAVGVASYLVVIHHGIVTVAGASFQVRSLFVIALAGLTVLWAHM